MRYTRIAIAAALLAAAPAARGATLTYLFEGIVTTLVTDGGLFGPPGSVLIGDSFSGHFSYETGLGNPDQLPADTENGGYLLIDLVVDQSVLPAFSPLGIGVTHDDPDATFPQDPPDFGRDWFTAFASSNVVYPTVSVRLRGPFESAFTNDSLPLALDLADFSDLAVVQGLVTLGLDPFPSNQDVGQITSLVLVPEPSTVALVAAGLAALAGGRLRSA